MTNNIKMQAPYIYTDVPNRSNLGLQILLWLNAYEFGIWSMLYGFQLLYEISSFWNIQGIFTGLAFVIVNVCEILRIFSGYAGNLKAKPVDLSRFLVMTPLVILPVLLFLLITAKKFIILIHIMTYILFGFMSLEFLVGILTWQKLCTYQTQIYKIKRDMLLQQENIK